MAYTPRPKREVSCEICGETAFTHAPNWRFCSQKCKDDHWGRTRSCSQCGAVMWKGGKSAEVLLIPDHRPENLRAAHRRCNASRGNQIEAAAC